MANTVTVPFNRYVVITKSDTVNFVEGPCEGIWVGGTGNVVVVMEGGDTCTFTGVPAGNLMPVRAIRVNSTNTTATNMVALYHV